jgi:hypothetical protein
MFLLVVSCHDEPFDNPLDPASPDYIPPLTADEGNDRQLRRSERYQFIGI